MPAVSKETKQYVTFSLNEELFAADVFKVREILEVPDITRVPGMPAYMSGVINIRGQVVPVVDLKMKFGLGATERHVETAIVVVEIQNEGDTVLMGVVVDAAHQVISLDSDSIEPPPRIGLFMDNRYLKGMGKVADDRFVIILDLEKILTEDEVSKIAEKAAVEGEEEPEE